MPQINKLQKSKTLGDDSIILESANNIYQSTSSGTVFVDGVVKEFSVRDGDYMKVKTYTGRTNNSRNKRGGFRRILTVSKTKGG